jgi:hypothetical protein
MAGETAWRGNSRFVLRTKILLAWRDQAGLVWRRRRIWHVWAGSEMQTVLVGKHERMRALRRYTRRWENNIKFISSRTGSRGRFLWSQYWTFGLQICEEFLEWLSNYLLLQVAAPRIQAPFPETKNRKSCFHEWHWRPHPQSVSTQQRGTKPPLPAAGIRWSPRLAPWPWHQCCTNCSTLVHLNQRISGSAAKNR